MSYASYFDGECGLTAKMQARQRRVALINEPLVMTSSITRRTRKLIETKAAISLKDGALIAEGTATQFVVNSQNKEDKVANNA